MKVKLAFASMVFLLLVSVCLANGTVSRGYRGCHGIRRGCHGEQELAPVESGCHGLVLQAPASLAKDDCHGRPAARLTIGERLTARSIARSNFRATLTAAKLAGRLGDGIAPVELSAPSMSLVPVSSLGEREE